MNTTEMLNKLRAWAELDPDVVRADAMGIIDAQLLFINLDDAMKENGPNPWEIENRDMNDNGLPPLSEFVKGEEEKVHTLHDFPYTYTTKM